MEGMTDHKTYGHAIDRYDMYINHGSNKQVMQKKQGLALVC
jgi:hypothetical protein